MTRLRRSLLFVPGNNPGMLINAPVLGADSVIFDLEDAVSIDEKDSARCLVSHAISHLDYSSVEVIVRINPLDSVFGEKDVEAVCRYKPDALMIPKATVESVMKVDSFIREIEDSCGFQAGSIKLVPLIETAWGVEKVFDIASASRRVVAILLGGEDLTSDMGVKRTKEGGEILYARNKVATVCRALKIDAIDTPFTDVEDFPGLLEDTTKAKNLGFSGKAAINPRQIDTIHQVFAPSQQEIEYALSVLEARDKAEKEGRGVFSLRGKMVDAPVIKRAETVIEQAKMLRLL